MTHPGTQAPPCPRRRIAADGGFTLVELMVVVTVVGVLGAVAVPQFVRYLRRSRTTEVHEALAKLATGATAYYHTEHFDRRGRPLSRRFPGQTPWTPALECCQQPGDRCAAAPTSWTHASWQALGFTLDGNHYYQYRVSASSGVNENATVELRARGDLDCDGTRGVWRHDGRATSGGEVTFGGLVIAAGREIE